MKPKHLFSMKVLSIESSPALSGLVSDFQGSAGSAKNANEIKTVQALNYQNYRTELLQASLKAKK